MTEDDQREPLSLGPREPSTSTLPPLHTGAVAPGALVSGSVNKTQPKPRGAAVRRVEAPRREAFLSGLLNEDLANLSKWHGLRPAHEQKRFLQSVDSLYKAFCAADEGPKAAPRSQKMAQAQAEAQARAQAQAAHEAALARYAEEDPLNGPPRSPGRGSTPALGISASAPSIALNPIDVFETNRRKELKSRRVRDEDPNSLRDWLEAQSLCTSATGTTASTTRLTSLSQITKTSSGGSRSICSEPGTVYQSTFKVHKRGRAANQSKFGCVQGDQHAAANLKDGLPNNGMSDAERLQTCYREIFGHKPLGENYNENMYGSVFQNDQHPFVEKYIEQARPEEKAKFGHMVRSLEWLRKAPLRQMSLQKEEMDLYHNRRLFKPSRARPVRDSAKAQMSTVPIGTAGLVVNGTMKPPTPPASAGPPPSPSVSCLGSVALSRLSTPLIGVRDLPPNPPSMSSTAPGGFLHTGDVAPALHEVMYENLE